MTTTAERTTTARSWPPRLEVPASSWVQWEALTAALARLGAPPLCSDDPERWWSRDPEDVADAVAVCGLCPLREPCLAYAVAADEREGTWGGVSEAERRQITRRRA